MYTPIARCYSRREIHEERNRESVMLPSCRTKSHAVVVLALLGSLGCGGSAGTSGGAAPIIEGKVFVDGKPLESSGLGLVFEGAGDPPRYTIPIEPDGTYSGAVPAGTYTVRVESVEPGGKVDPKSGILPKYAAGGDGMSVTIEAGTNSKDLEVGK